MYLIESSIAVDIRNNPKNILPNNCQENINSSLLMQVRKYLEIGKAQSAGTKIERESKII